MTLRAVTASFSALSLAVLLPGCAVRSFTSPSGPSVAAEVSSSPSSIGAAWLASDGALMLQLRAEVQRGAIGDALLRIEKADPRHSNYLRHIGGLQLGEVKPVPPWP